jgi:hypothetical protein
MYCTYRNPAAFATCLIGRSVVPSKLLDALDLHALNLLVDGPAKKSLEP